MSKKIKVKKEAGRLHVVVQAVHCTEREAPPCSARSACALARAVSAWQEGLFLIRTNVLYELS